MEKDNQLNEKADFLVAELSKLVQVPFTTVMGSSYNSTEVDDLKPD